MPRPKKESPTGSNSNQLAKQSESSFTHKSNTPAFTMTTRRKAAAMASHEISPNEESQSVQSPSSSVQPVIVPRHIDLPASTITPESIFPSERSRKRNAESSASSQPTPPKAPATSSSDEHPASLAFIFGGQSSALISSQSTSHSNPLSSPTKRLPSVEIQDPPPSASQPASLSTVLTSHEVHRSISSTADDHQSDLMFSPPSIDGSSDDIDEEEQAALEAEQADAELEDPSTPAPALSSDEEDVGELGELPDDEQDDDVSLSPDFTLERSKPVQSLYPFP